MFGVWHNINNLCLEFSVMRKTMIKNKIFDLRSLLNNHILNSAIF